MDLSRALLCHYLSEEEIATLLFGSLAAYAISAILTPILIYHVSPLRMGYALALLVLVAFVCGTLNMIWAERGIGVLVVAHVVTTIASECIYAHLRFARMQYAAYHKETDLAAVFARMGASNWIGYFVGVIIVVGVGSVGSFNPLGAIAITGVSAIGAHGFITAREKILRTTITSLENQRIALVSSESASAPYALASVMTRLSK